MNSVARAVGGFCTTMALAACGNNVAGVLTLSTTAHIGGEAKFSGTVGYLGDCLQLQTLDQRRWTLIFPAQTREEAGGITSPSFGSIQIPLSEATITGSTLRDNGVGWSSKSINKIVRGKLPAACRLNVIYVAKIEPHNP